MQEVAAGRQILEEEPPATRCDALGQGDGAVFSEQHHHHVIAAFALVGGMVSIVINEDQIPHRRLSGLESEAKVPREVRGVVIREIIRVGEESPLACRFTGCRACGQIEGIRHHAHEQRHRRVLACIIIGEW